MTVDEIHRAFHLYFSGKLPAGEEDALFTAAENAGYLHACTRNCPKGLNHG
jgi:hypothetical protein